MAGREPATAEGIDPAIVEYKRILRDILDARPSGTRQRLAAALGKNRSFVSQISNSAYAVPIPATHLDIIFEVCHFPPAMRDRFLAAYGRAHPRRFSAVSDPKRLRAHTIYLPDLGDPGRNEKLDALVNDFLRRLINLVDR